LNNKDDETTVVKSKANVFKTNQAVTPSNREPDYCYTDGEYEIHGHKNHHIIGDTDETHYLMEQAREPTFKLEDREKVLLDKFKSTNVKYVWLRYDLTALQENSFYSSETSKGICPGLDLTYVAFVINEVMK
jgi:hypothetical protein